MNSAPLRFAAVVTAALTLTGCVSSKYKLAKSTTTTNPVALNLAATTPEVAATVQTVIAYKGPGSWKNEAYWDEYVLTLANRTDQPVIVSAVTLENGRSPAIAPGADPWELEKASRTALARNFDLAKNTAVQIGGGVATVTAGVIAGSLISPAGWIVPAGAGPGFLVALPIAIGGTIYRNVSSRHEIEAEFNRRRLVLPLSLAPGQTIQGSLYYPITPAPSSLTLRHTSHHGERDLSLKLAPLAGLHLKPSSTVASTTSPK
jgi:outer membrane murein-binding lipoprotein Lpp